MSFMSDVGLRELRQQASDLVRRAERGEEIIITVAGRPSARLVPVRRRQWLTADEVRPIFDSAAYPNWERDRDLIDQTIRDPWAD